jgi:hypothetical protein
MILKRGKWKNISNLDKYQQMRDLIKRSYQGLVFVNEGHRYYYNGKQLESVSNITHLFTPKFDAAAKSQEMYEKYYNDPTSKYYQMTQQQILEQWTVIKDTACDNGTNVHEFGESCFYFMTYQDDKILPNFKDRLNGDEFNSINEKEDAVVKFWNDLPQCFVPIASENQVCREDLGYSGTFDLLFYYDAELDNKTPDKSGFVIFDYKTNKDLYKNFMGERMLYPFNELLNCSFNVYQLQLSLYQLALEPIGFKVIGRRIIWLKDDSSYEKINTNSYTYNLYYALINKATN